VRRSSGGLSSIQVPGSHVVLWIANDPQIGKVGGSEVDPPLVSKEALRDVRVAKMQEAMRPPLEESLAFQGWSNAQESKVINSVLKRADLTVENGLERIFWLRQMRRQEDAMLVKQVLKSVQRRQHNDIRIEVVDVVRIVPVHDLLGRWAFDRGTKFNDG